MELRAASTSDLAPVFEIDATVESHRYLHIDRSGEGLNVSWKVEDRPLRERLITTLDLDEDRKFLYRQIVTGIEDGIVRVADHDGVTAAAMLAQVHGNVLKLIDLRVDFDHRRQGLATAMLYQLIQTGREEKLRAIRVQTTANNNPANQMLAKLGFVLAGLDSHRNSNHDLVKEAVTLVWYFTLD